MTKEDDPVAANRRRQLRKWIDTHCGTSQAVFIASTNDGIKQINQGELSALLKNKSFGERRARSLEKQSGMPSGYLDLNEQKKDIFTLQENGQEKPTLAATAMRTWPFETISHERLVKLKRELGPRRGLDAMHDIDKTLEIVVLKWEKALSELITQNKSTAA